MASNSQEPKVNYGVPESFVDRKSVVQGKSVDLGGRRIIKKNLKVLGIFAGIGIMSLLMASNSQEPKVNYGVPESFVWEFHTDEPLAINRVTGEVRKYNTSQVEYNKLRNLMYWRVDKYVRMNRDNGKDAKQIKVQKNPLLSEALNTTLLKIGRAHV